MKIWMTSRRAGAAASILFFISLASVSGNVYCDPANLEFTVEPAVAPVGTRATITIKNIGGPAASAIQPQTLTVTKPDGTVVTLFDFPLGTVNINSGVSMEQSFDDTDLEGVYTVTLIYDDPMLDEVFFTRTESIVIPTLSRLGLVVLISLLIAAGSIALRKRSSYEP